VPLHRGVHSNHCRDSQLIVSNAWDQLLVLIPLPHLGGASLEFLGPPSHASSMGAATT
jgi:hypothetical protein